MEAFESRAADVVNVSGQLLQATQDHVERHGQVVGEVGQQPPLVGRGLHGGPVEGGRLERGRHVEAEELEHLTGGRRETPPLRPKDHQGAPRARPCFRDGHREGHAGAQLPERQVSAD